MIKKNSKPTLTLNREIVVPYTRTGSYMKGQRILHPFLGMGTVIYVRSEKVVILLDADKGKKGRRFLSAKLSLSQRRLANGMEANNSLPAFPIVQGNEAALRLEETRCSTVIIDLADAYDDLDEAV